MKHETINNIFLRMPTLCSERLVMRAMRHSDSHDMYEYACREDVTEYLLWRPHPSEDYTRDYLGYVESRYRAGDFYDWAVVLRDSDKMIGTCGFNSFDIKNNCAEIGYVLNPAYWGAGYATEAVQTIIKFGFIELNLNRIEARYMLGNERSRSVMERCDMEYEGTLRSAILVGREYKTICLHSILFSEYTMHAIENEKLKTKDDKSE